MASSLTFSNNVLHYTFDAVGSESLLHFDGLNNSTTFTDATGKHTWSRGAGVAVLDTSQTKFGASSLHLTSTSDQFVGDGTINWGSNDFTIDFWIYFNGTQAQTNVFEMVGNATGVIYTLGGGDVLRFYCLGDVIVGTTPITVNAWHHFALTRQGATHYLFLDGHLEGTWINSGSNFGVSPAQYPLIGQGGGYSPVGWIDELRILIGTAAWISSFTVPTTAYSSIGIGVPDSSTSNNTGIFSGSGTTAVVGQINNALSFNGNGYLTFTNVSQLGLATPASPWSTSFWVKTTQTSGVIFALRGNTPGPLGVLLMSLGYASGVPAGTPAFITQGDGASGYGTYGGVVATVPVNDGNWHHIAVTRDATQLCSMYIDGALNTTQYDGLSGAGITPVVANSLLGIDVANAPNYGYVGLLDDFQIYNRALTATEVASIHTAGVSGSVAISANFAGSGSFNARAGLISTHAFAATWAGSGNLGAQLTQQSVPHTYALAATFKGAGALQPTLSQFGTPQRLLLSAAFAGAGALSTTWYLAYVKAIHYPTLIPISASFAGEGGLQVVIPISDVNIYMTTDQVNPGIYPTAGSEVLYKAASGLEKAMADVDAGRLIATYAELVRDQWDPWAISYRNLGYLAWAQGVNLWEDDWSEEQRRQWVANQWTFKYYRGSDLGMKMAIEAVNAKVKNIVRPPALFYPGPALTDAERQAYVARFPQLRLYPYAPRPQLPWLNYLGGKTYDPQGNPITVRNGYFNGPFKLFFPTNFNAGGLYLRASTLYDPYTGVETQLTVRTVTGVPMPGMPVTTYDEIQLPINPGNLFFPGNDNKRYLFPRGTPLTVNRRHSVVLGRLPFEDNRLIRVPRDGTLNITQYQAIFQTIAPSLRPLNVRPEMVSVIHPMRSTELYCGQPLTKKFMPKTNAAKYIYERWYLFDPTRQPDQRWARVYMGRARFGIPKYSAKIKVDAAFHWPNTYTYANGYIGKGWFFPPKNTKRIDQVRRAVTSAMALRDTVQIDTKVKRMIQFADITLLDGTFSFGEYITDSW